MAETWKSMLFQLSFVPLASIISWSLRQNSGPIYNSTDESRRVRDQIVCWQFLARVGSSLLQIWIRDCQVIGIV